MARNIPARLHSNPNLCAVCQACIGNRSHVTQWIENAKTWEGCPCAPPLLAASWNPPLCCNCAALVKSTGCVLGLGDLRLKQRRSVLPWQETEIRRLLAPHLACVLANLVVEALDGSRCRNRVCNQLHKCCFCNDRRIAVSPTSVKCGSWWADYCPGCKLLCQNAYQAATQTNLRRNASCFWSNH
jgi:hypothetical protein